MNDEQIKEALKIIREPITVHQENYKYFDEENYNKLLMVYENCRWFINNWEQLEINFKDLQKQLETYEKENQRLNNIIKFLKKYFKEHEYYEESSLLEQLESKHYDENWNGWKEL